MRFFLSLIVTTLVALSSAVAENDLHPLHDIFDAEWERFLQEHPVQASRIGDTRYADRWPDVSLQAERRSVQKLTTALRKVQEFEPGQLSAADRLNQSLFVWQAETELLRRSHRLHLLPLNQRGGIQSASSITDQLSFESVEDYEQWIRRLRAFPKYMAQTMAVMKQGIREGMLHPRVVMQRVPPQIRQQIVDAPEHSLFYKPFLDMPPEVSEANQQRLQRSAREAVNECILPAYREFLKFFEGEYLPACFAKVGCWQRPNGQQMYADLAQCFTTTMLTPDEIHKTGLSEVARIRTHMESIQQQVEFEGTFQEFLEHMRSDSQFYYEQANDLLEAYRACCRRIDPQLPRLFHRLPKIPYDVRAIPAQLAPDTTTAYYQPPSGDGQRPGGYFVNMFRPETRPKYEIEALSLHESVPGHHLQIALAMELADLPSFRRHGRCTAFVEGWGLYSEKLGEELGLYQDPYSRFGQLTYEMWRAVRLVVDTGMHSKKWTRQQAIQFFTSNTARSSLDIANEVDRYIAWPGQALAYKIGELRIRELRSRAEQQLGANFDVRDFHEVVLGNGAVPLNVLEEEVDRWLNAQPESGSR